MTLICPNYDYTPWLIYDAKFNCIGIRDDAPQEAKDEFERVSKAANQFIGGLRIK